MDNPWCHVLGVRNWKWRIEIWKKIKFNKEIITIFRFSIKFPKFWYPYCHGLNNFGFSTTRRGRVAVKKLNSIKAGRYGYQNFGNFMENLNLIVLTCYFSKHFKNFQIERILGKLNIGEYASRFSITCRQKTRQKLENWDQIIVFQILHKISKVLSPILIGFGKILKIDICGCVAYRYNVSGQMCFLYKNSLFQIFWRQNYPKTWKNSRVTDFRKFSKIFENWNSENPLNLIIWL